MSKEQELIYHNVSHLLNENGYCPICQMLFHPSQFISQPTPSEDMVTLTKETLAALLVTYLSEVRNNLDVNATVFAKDFLSLWLPKIAKQSSLGDVKEGE